MMIRIRPLFSVVCFCLVVWLSYYHFALYSGGDLVHYRLIFLQVPRHSFVESILLYQSSLTSAEVLHFLYVYLMGPYFQHHFAMMFVNGLLAALVFSFYHERTSDLLWSLLFACSSFYMLVLFGPAERLKFGFLVLFLALVFTKKKSSRFAGSLLAVFGHLQMSFVVMGFGLFVAVRFLTRIASLNGITGIKYRWLLVFCIFVFSLLYLSPDILVVYIDKLKYYFNISIYGLAKVGIIFAATLLLSRKNDYSLIISLFIPILIGSLLLGEQRLSVFAFFYSLYFVRSKGLLPVFYRYAALIFLIQKSIIYFRNVVENGVGF